MFPKNLLPHAHRFVSGLDGNQHRALQLAGCVLVAFYCGFFSLRSEVFPDGINPDRDWDDYHLVRNEYDRRAAEEFDLGQ